MSQRHRSSAPFETVGVLMGQWPSVAEFARDIGIKPSHAQVMKVRGSIPVDYWPATISAARARGIKGVTAELLMKLHRGVRAVSGTAPTRVRVVKSGKGQVLQLPKQFHFRAKEVEIFRRGEEVVLREPSRGMARAFEIIANLPIEDLADERDVPPQEREGL
jgi:antitoxin VapB